jgi:glycosyltransferase involved in cell wall biosynthesis
MTSHKPRIVFVTQLLDELDPVMGFLPNQLRELASQTEQLWVIANGVGQVPSDLGAAVVSLGKEDGRGRGGKTLRYLTALWRIGRSGKVDALVAHMSPVYLNLAAPIARMFRWRLLLWFAHPAYGPGVKVAERLTDLVVTSLPGAYPGRTSKVHVIGQAIDTERFSYSKLPSLHQDLRLISLGRASPYKRHDVLFEAASLLTKSGLDTHVDLYAPTTNAFEQKHLAELEVLRAQLDLRQRIEIRDGVSPSEVPRLLDKAHVLVSTTDAGGGDKAVFEAMASGRLVAVSNPAFRELLEGLPLRLTFEHGSSSDLADLLRAVLQATPDVREKTAQELSNRVRAGHSARHWAHEIVKLAKEAS